MMTTTATVGERTVEVEFDVHGGFYPGSYDEPPEYPEVEIAHVWLDHAGKRRDVLARLTDAQVEELEDPCLLAAEEIRGDEEIEARIASREYDDVPF